MIGVDVSVYSHSAGLIGSLADHEQRSVCQYSVLLLSCMWPVFTLAASTGDSEWV